MKDILFEIARNKREEVKSIFPSEKSIKELLSHENLKPTFSISQSILNHPGGIIAEFKRRSPSKGDIFPMADVAEIIPKYRDNGASAVSVLTDTRFFGGSSVDLALARNFSSEIPLLRKDFIVSEKQILEARILGASAILLIAAILSPSELQEYNEITHSLKMEALVEIHDLDEINKISFKPDLLGINNRNLSSFHTDLSHSLKLSTYLPVDTLLIAESGIKSPIDINRLKEVGYRGFLIGEAFMSSKEPGVTLKKFIDETSC